MMPYAKTGAGYPIEFQEIADACSKGASVEVLCESEKQARGRRARWYQYVGALKRDANHTPAWGDKQLAIELARKAMATEVRLDGTKVIFCGRDNTPAMLSFKENMTITYPETGVAVAPAQSEAESIARLMEKLKGDGNG